LSCIDQTDAGNIINAQLGVASYTEAATPMKLKLGTTAPTATADMTELSATGYTTGGTSMTFNSASAGATSNSSSATWTNSSGSSWTGIVGLEIWDSAGTPKRHLYGNWTGEPIVIAAGNSFQVADAGITYSLG
jgi:hypothetical protein